MGKKIKCNLCGGSGKCKSCEGRGIKNLKICNYCNGSKKCCRCNGTGKMDD